MVIIANYVINDVALNNINYVSVLLWFAAFEASDKRSEAKFNSSMINSVASEKVFQCQPSGRKTIAPSLCQSHPLQPITRITCKTLPFAHMIHSTNNSRNMQKWYSRLQLGI